jgi:hypothetical protein
VRMRGKGDDSHCIFLISTYNILQSIELWMRLMVNFGENKELLDVLMKDTIYDIY